MPPDTETLAAIAETTGGRSFEAPTASDLAQIYESLGSRVGYTTEEREVTQWFAAAGLAARRRRRRARRPLVQPVPMSRDRDARNEVAMAQIP